MARSNEQTSDAFVRAVEKALDNFTNPAWLGSHSPLAAPYFLGHTLDPYEQNRAVIQRGRALQAALRDAALQLDEETRELLHVVYFERNPRLDNVGLTLALHLSERTFYRSKGKAVAELARTLNQAMLPTLRSAGPTYKFMVGRTNILESCLLALRAGRSIHIAGVSGTGKTTLGAAIARAWLAPGADRTALPNQQTLSVQPIFWFTIRPGLNDYLANIVFAFGHFLRILGASQTWRQLVADQGVIHIERILSLLRYDLQVLHETPILLCIDEVDLLQTETQEHAQIIHLLEELSNVVPLLLLGQRAVIATDEYQTLTGLTEIELTMWLTQRGLPPLEPAIQQQLLVQTNGNPALLNLLLTLYDVGDTIDDSLQALAGSPSVEALLTRIWRHLQQNERQLLMQLAIFRSPSPLDAWAAEQTTVEILLQRELIQLDGYGGVQIAPHLRTVVYERIPAELRPVLHLQAGAIRETRAEYLSAIHHAIQGRQPALAIWLWYANRNTEIEGGRGAAALSLLNTIATADLANEQDRYTLRAARSELYKLAGRPEEAEAELQPIPSTDDSRFSANVHLLRGEVLEIQGRVEQAIESYRAALETLSGSTQQREVTIHTRIGFLQEYHFQNRAAARREALLARIKAEGFHGSIEELAGNYHAARERYQTAYELALSLGENNLSSLSNAYSQLGVLTLKQGDYQAAISLIKQAMDCDQQLGDQVSPLYDQLNLSYAYFLAGQADEAKQVANDGLAVAKRLGHRYLMAGLAAGIGEACFALQQLAEAEQYATYSLQQEEVFFRPSALIVLGLVRQAQHQHEQAVQFIREAIETAHEIEDKFTEAYAWHMLGIVLQKANDVTSARNAFQTALRLYSELNLPHKVRELQVALQI